MKYALDGGNKNGLDYWTKNLATWLFFQAFFLVWLSDPRGQGKGVRRLNAEKRSKERLFACCIGCNPCLGIQSGLAQPFDFDAFIASLKSKRTWFPVNYGPKPERVWVPLLIPCFKQ